MIIDVTEVDLRSHRVKMLSNYKKYISELKSMLTISHDTENAYSSITLSSLDRLW